MFQTEAITKKGYILVLVQNHGKAFNEMKEQVQKVAEVGHFKKRGKIRIVNDASKAGLGAVLQQQDEIGRRPIHFASRLLTPIEDKNSIT